MPITFKIELGSAFNSFNRELLSPRNYEKSVIHNFAELNNNYSEYLRIRNKHFALFEHGDRLRIFRKKSETKEMLREFHQLIIANTPYFTYDFRGLSKEMNLRDFM